ncbi:MAG: hypothetical protein FWD18_00475 [Micrococcales bacterium]|nr:hypothetical protein [Micrococcales bacterium]
MDKTDTHQLVTGWLRTVVPGSWAAFIAWALSTEVLPTWLGDLVQDHHVATTSVVVGLVLAVWYAAWRRIEPHVPDWLVRIALGSARPPMYAAVVASQQPTTPTGQV